MTPRERKLQDFRHSDRPGRPLATVKLATIHDGDRVAVKVATTTLLEPGRRARHVPVGATGVVERTSSCLLRITLDARSPIDGKPDMIIMAASLVRRVQ